MTESAFEPTPADLEPVDETEVERIRSEVFIRTVRGMNTDLERIFIRTALGFHAFAIRIGVDPLEGWRLFETALRPAFETQMRDDNDRENWVAVSTRLRKFVFGEDTEGGAQPRT